MQWFVCNQDFLVSELTNVRFGFFILTCEISFFYVNFLTEAILRGPENFIP